MAFNASRIAQEAEGTHLLAVIHNVAHSGGLPKGLVLRVTRHNFRISKWWRDFTGPGSEYRGAGNVRFPAKCSFTAQCCKLCCHQQSLQSSCLL